ncbi:MAG: hypothetical protein ACFWTY_19200 [Shouchella clausii]|jgi:hypothetical protein
MDHREQWQAKTKELTLLLMYLNSWIEKDSWGSIGVHGKDSILMI